jgi:thioredoxin reductase (NADPH)
LTKSGGYGDNCWMSAEFDVVVAGSGIAGLTAALTAARLGRKTLVLSGNTLGGLLLSINRIDGYPGFPDGVAGYDLCPMAQDQAAAAGTEFAPVPLERLSAQDGGWLIGSGTGEEYRARAVILATGAELRELDIPGAARLKGKGVSHCASCDAPLLRNKTVAVVGGGDSAAQEALTLAEFASRVLILHRGTALSAQHAYRDALAAHPRIELRFETVVEEVLGDTGVTGARLRDGTGAAADVELAGIFAYIGLQPNTSFLEGRLALDPAGRIATDGWMRTELEGICAIGAVRAGWAGRAAISAGDGAMAALAVDRYLCDRDWRRR